MTLNRLGLRSRLDSIAPILARLRRRLAWWIYPGERGCAEVPSPRTAELLTLAETLVRHYGFAELTHPTMLDTFYRWAGCNKYYKHNHGLLFLRRIQICHTITRLLKHPSTCPRPEMHHRVMQAFSNDWPADLPWPSDIPRPAPQLPPAA